MEILEISSKFTSTIATIFAGLIAAYIANKYQKNNLDLSREKMEKDLFTEFNKRYDELNDSLTLLSNISSTEELKATESLIENKSMYNVLIDYFNLCAEQFYWKEKERISKEIWKSWNKGMKFYYDGYAVVRELWEEETKDEKYESYYLKQGRDFFKEN
ncbi:hypothetical protein JOE44_004524 [Chryseobacterium sp. PvR013]|uniref:hypothetical protein n=1 Tax=Chryseobacterium sp. PvR013 TaxID=2806595 RepID=UPI001AE8E2F4|nr:hypothetical protein [Chryseobacterium sp. PvR013]MBP1167640.1 hypothetical protein [Chryseobacterium sp. PvR013]